MGIVTEKEPPLRLLGKEGADLDYWCHVGYITHNPMFVQVMCSKCYSASLDVKSMLTGRTPVLNNRKVNMSAVKTTEGVYYVGGCSTCGTIYWGEGNN